MMEKMYHFTVAAVERLKDQLFTEEEVRNGMSIQVGKDFYHVEPYTEQVKGDKVRCRDDEQEGWNYGFYVRRNDESTYPHQVRLCHSIDSFVICEPYEWTINELFDAEVE